MRDTTRVVLAIILALNTLGIAQVAQAKDRPGPSRLYDANVDLSTLQEADFEGFGPADYASLPRRVRDAVTTPVETVMLRGRTLDPRATTLRDPAEGVRLREECWTVWRTVYRNNALGWHLMTVQNKEYGCGDGIYFTEQPINLSSAKGSYGWAFSAWRDYTSGWCSSTHLSWVQILTARFKFGLTGDLAALSNVTVFFGGGGQHAGGC